MEDKIWYNSAPLIPTPSGSVTLPSWNSSPFPTNLHLCLAVHFVFRHSCDLCTWCSGPTSMDVAQCQQPLLPEWCGHTLWHICNILCQCWSSVKCSNSIGLGHKRTEFDIHVQMPSIESNEFALFALTNNSQPYLEIRYCDLIWDFLYIKQFYPWATAFSQRPHINTDRYPNSISGNFTSAH